MLKMINYGSKFFSIQGKNASIFVYIPGRSFCPHLLGPKLTMPNWYQGELSVRRKLAGPPESPLHASNPKYQGKFAKLKRIQTESYSLSYEKGSYNVYYTFNTPSTKLNVCIVCFTFFACWSSRLGYWYLYLSQCSCRYRILEVCFQWFSIVVGYFAPTSNGNQASFIDGIYFWIILFPG